MIFEILRERKARQLATLAAQREKRIDFGSNSEHFSTQSLEAGVHKIESSVDGSDLMAVELLTRFYENGGANQ